MMTVCEEMQKLRKMLNEKGIEWKDNSEVISESEEWPVWFCRTQFEFKGYKFSVINGFGTYGGWYGANPGMAEDKNMGLLELMIEELEPVGWLKAENIMEILGEKE